MKRKEQNGHLLGVKKCYMKLSLIPKKQFSIYVVAASNYTIGSNKGNMYTIKHLRMVGNIDIQIP